MRYFVGVMLYVCATATLAIDAPIPYAVVSATGYSGGQFDAKHAYFRMKRGDFDRETMVEVGYVNKPSDLPAPTVIEPSPLPMVKTFIAGKVLSKKDLKGEDRIFQTIYDDIEHDKCVLNPKRCAPPPPAQQRRQFLPTDQ